MYPRSFFDTYWGPHIRNEVFVAMPFHDEFQTIWEQAIKPAIEKDLHQGGIKLLANRVDTTVLSGNVVQSILDGIAHARLIFVDVSVAKRGAWVNQRNGNVMYELGLAHAIRPETDLIVVRNDNERINFDIANILIHSYSADDLKSAEKLFAYQISEALCHRHRMMALQIEKVSERLDANCKAVMFEFGINKQFEPFGVNRDAPLWKHLAINKLLDLGIIVCEVTAPCCYHYRWTEFGVEVYKRPKMAEVIQE
ncbi:hypothetical protein [Prosthecobacter sp.]|uniref:hypothetical protein n=1 Tax=Prosthecobacter sp. TaxID=1965333 RepID=UPI002AB8C5F9|nr:hypothetical protein [Prosthecobacter sp.]MDZ4402909.1 hypothetical protein [Prosthecobacter sp.]